MKQPGQRFVGKAAYVLTSLLLFCFSSAAQTPADEVDPFIGTAGGNTFPGAVRPWGMVSVSPHNAASPSGYIWNSPRFFGFGHVHLSGTGCADLGSILIAASRGNLPQDPGNTSCAYTNEVAMPGYYRVDLVQPELRAEATATVRCGFIRFQSREPGEVFLLINAGKSLALEGGGSIRIVSDTEIEGYNISGGFCGEANRQTVYFVARFNRRSETRGLWKGSELSGESSLSMQDVSLGAWMSFRVQADDTILVKTGISYVSVENARRNLDAEIPDWDFDRVLLEARNAWNTELSRVKIEGGSREERTMFYTAMYHCLIHPNIINDVNGEFPLMGRAGTGRYSERDRYSVFSLWDTYRTLHPFLTLVYPEKAATMLQTMIDMYRESGWLPKWELAANETRMMVGDPAVPVIADTYLKGIRDFDIEIAYEAILKHATESARGSGPIRPGYHEQVQYGYIPFEQDTTTDWWVWGPVSNTLEYCLADWTTAQLARALGKMEDAEEFHRRSLFYRNLFDPTTMFLRPRRKDGSWLAPFDPLATEGSGSWKGSGGPGYVEGNAWNYTWFVPHDISGLADLFGGERPFLQKLSECFDRDLFTIGNEPDIAYPYLFSYFPQTQHLTRRYVRQIIESKFGTGPSGLPGDDDAGAISAWLVFSALGFYPDCPASTTYRLGEPLFPMAVITLNQRYYRGREFFIEARLNADRSRVLLNNSPLESNAIDHGQIVGGGRLVFEFPRE